MRALIFTLVLTAGCQSRPPPPKEDPAAVVAATTRSFYGLASEWHEVSMAELAARTTMLATPSHVSLSERCFHYLERVDWAYIDHHDCITGIVLGEVEGFRFDDKMVKDRKLGVTSKDDLLRRLQAANRPDAVAFVEMEASEVGGRVRMTRGFEVDLPSGAISLETGKIYDALDWTGTRDP